MTKAPSTEAPARDHLSASVQLIPLPSGLYLFSVATAGLAGRTATGQMALPAVHVGLGPGVKTDAVEFIDGPSNQGAWLFTAGDLLVAKIHSAGATLILTSIRGHEGEALSIKVERLGAAHAGAPAAARPGDARVPAAPGAAAADAPATDPNAVPTQISAHVRTRGDMRFDGVSWAGRVAPGLWIESFSVLPQQQLRAVDVEYKGLTGSGFETPWISMGHMCGTQGMAVPLVGFAVRMKAGPLARLYECQYSGYFKSGATVGPLRDGAPCRSTIANDPLEGIQLQIRKRAVADARVTANTFKGGVSGAVIPLKRSAAAAADTSTAARVKPPRGNGEPVSADREPRSRPAGDRSERGKQRASGRRS